MKKYKVISYKKEEGKFDHYIFNLHCNIHNYDYIVEGTYKTCEEILKASNCGCPYCGGGNQLRANEYKLSLLTKYDLEGMDWSVIIDLIGEDKLPKDFYCLCKFGPNTEGRKEQIKKLKEIYNIKTKEETEVENNVNELIENEVSDVDNFIYNEFENESFEDELKPYKDIEDIGDLINISDEEIYSTGDKYQHIFSKEMSKLWGLILRDDENHSTKNIDIIKVKVNDSSITPFSKHIYEEFLKEYNEVMNFNVN